MKEKEIEDFKIDRKERLEKKFYVAKDTLALLIGAMKEFNNTN